MSNNVIISVENLTYVYGKGTPFQSTALDKINLKIEKGRITGIIGHTGSGKSTLVQHFNGLLKVESGKVFLDGVDIWENPKKIRDVRFRVGLVFQYPEYQLFEETVYKDIAFGPKNMGLSDEEINKRVCEAADFVGITPDLLEKSPFELSGGQKRRVAIAGIIAMKPEVLILDEPAAGLDPMGREEILGGIKAYQRISKSTVIIVSHSMEDMARYSDNIVIMKDGKILSEGPCNLIFANTEMLLKNGLGIPSITSLMKKIKALGIPCREDIFTVEAAVEEIKALYSKGGGIKC